MIKLLYVVLVLSTVAVLGAAVVIYWRVRKHLSASTAARAKAAAFAGESGKGEQPKSE